MAAVHQFGFVVHNLGRPRESPALVGNDTQSLYCVDNRGNTSLEYKQMYVCRERRQTDVCVCVSLISCRVDVQAASSDDEEVGSSEVRSCWLPN